LNIRSVVGGTANRPTMSPTTAPTRTPTCAPTQQPTTNTKKPTRVPTAGPTSVGVYWIPDSISVSSTYNARTTVGTSGWDFNLTVNSNGLLYDDPEKGHFHINFVSQNHHGLTFVGRTECLQVGSPAVVVQRAVEQTKLFQRNASNVGDLASGSFYTVSSFYRVDSHRYYHRSDGAHLTTSFVVGFDNSNNKTAQLTVTYSTGDCAKIRTIGEWEDPAKWSNGQVPSEINLVTVPVGAGVVRLNGDVTVRRLLMDDGILLAHKTYCPHSWSIDPQSGTSDG
jgi:hypothetical protein